MRNWLRSQDHIVVMDWPPYSPNLNPVEHLWARPKQLVYELYPELLQHHRHNKEQIQDELITALHDA